jgi:hypothetical protein
MAPSSATHIVDPCRGHLDYTCQSPRSYCLANLTRPCENGTMCNAIFHKTHPGVSPCVDPSKPTPAPPGPPPTPAPPAPPPTPAPPTPASPTPAPAPAPAPDCPPFGVPATYECKCVWGPGKNCQIGQHCNAPFGCQSKPLCCDSMSGGQGTTAEHPVPSGGCFCNSGIPGSKTVACEEGRCVEIPMQ